VYDAPSVSSSPTVVFAGGSLTSTSAVVSTVYVSSNWGANWTLITSTPGWGARSGHQLVSDTDNYLYIVGGTVSQTVAFTDLWVSFNKGSTWSIVAVPGNSVSYFFYGQMIYIMQNIFILSSIVRYVKPFET
jgi:hypothetical protein